MSVPDPQASGPTAAAIDAVQRIFADLDYHRLGPIYCEEGGDAFWAEHREPARELGLQWAGALLCRLSPGGSSCYVGAGVAELPALVTEVVDLDRAVEVTNLMAEECDVLNAALTAAGLGERIRYRCVDAVAGVGAVDHLSVVSVLNDPETYPAVSGVAYGRIPPVLLDVEAFVQERGRLTVLVDALLARVGSEAIVTTTYEEVAWFLDAASRQGLIVEADEEVVPTAIVGDSLGFLRVARENPAP